jgi:hypothetical protein
MTIDELNALTTLTATDEVPVWDAEANSEPTKKITGSNLASSVKTLGSLLGTSDVVDNLTSTETDKPLAAAQGKALSEAIAQSTANVKQIDITTDTNGFFSDTRSGNFIVLKAWCTSSDVVIISYPANNSTEQGKNTWWFKAVNATTLEKVSSTALTVYYAFIIK